MQVSLEVLRLLTRHTQTTILSQALRLLTQHTRTIIRKGVTNEYQHQLTFALLLLGTLLLATHHNFPFLIPCMTTSFQKQSVYSVHYACLNCLYLKELLYVGSLPEGYRSTSLLLYYSCAPMHCSHKDNAMDMCVLWSHQYICMYVNNLTIRLVSITVCQYKPLEYTTMCINIS